MGKRERQRKKKVKKEKDRKVKRLTQAEEIVVKARGGKEKPQKVRLDDSKNWIKNCKSILVLGDGDFSFSRSLVRLREKETESSVSITATTLDSRGTVLHKYPKSENILEFLDTCSNVNVRFKIDATNLKKSFPSESFDRIIFNFPHSGKQRVHINRILLQDFFSSCKDILSKQGRIFVTLKTKPPYSHWNVIEQATTKGVIFRNTIKFDSRMFPGYRHQTTDPTADDLDVYSCKTFIFSNE